MPDPQSKDVRHRRYSSNSTCCVTTCRAWRDVLRHACSNMVDDEEATSSAGVWNGIMCCYYLLFQLTNKLSCMSRSSRRACRASRDGRVALAVQHARHCTYDWFLYQNACRDVTQQVELGLQWCQRALWYQLVVWQVEKLFYFDIVTFSVFSHDFIVCTVVIHIAASDTVIDDV